MRKLGARTLGVVLLLLVEMADARAVDLYAFRFRSFGGSASCQFGTQWRDDMIFHNTTAQDAIVRLVEMTGGEGDRTPQLAVPAGRTVTLANNPGLWQLINDGLWFRPGRRGSTGGRFGANLIPVPERDREYVAALRDRYGRPADVVLRLKPSE